MNQPKHNLERPSKDHRQSGLTARRTGNSADAKVAGSIPEPQARPSGPYGPHAEPYQRNGDGADFRPRRTSARQLVVETGH